MTYFKQITQAQVHGRIRKSGGLRRRRAYDLVQAHIGGDAWNTVWAQVQDQVRIGTRVRIQIRVRDSVK